MIMLSSCIHAYYNEIIFICHTALLCLSAAAAARIGIHALTGLMVVQVILSNLLVTQQATLFGLSVTCTDAFAVGASLTLNLIQEYGGIRTARNAIWTSFFCLIFFVLMAHIHLAYLPNSDDTMHPYFVVLFETSWRIVAASLVSYGISQHLESFLYAYFTRIFKERHYIVRNYSSLIISQGVDTALFSILALYGIVQSVWHVFIVGYTIKVCTIILATPLLALTQRIVGKKRPS